MESNFTFNEKGHFYELNGKRMYGVTTVLGVIAKPALVGWAARMAVEHIRENSESITNSTALIVLEEVLEAASKAHTKKKEAGGTKGTDAHALVETYIKGCIEKNNGFATEYLGEEKMLQKFVQWAHENKVKFLASEKRVYNANPDMFYAGTFDFSFEKDGKRFIGDLKTMKKVWDRTPFYQTAAYGLASRAMGEAPYDGSCIVNISKEAGNELTEHWSYDWESDEKCFLAALTLYKNLNQ